jgi:hypothetical protein
MKWIWVIVLVIVGALAAYVAIEYFTVSIHALPSFIPGHKAVGANGHPARGHYRRRGAVAAFVALVAFVAAAFLAFRIVKRDRATAPTAAPTGGQSASDIV